MNIPPPYREVAEAFVAGMQQRLESGEPLARVASVASFFLSRIDTLVDRRLDAQGGDGSAALRGQAAIACARLAYRHYQDWARSERWQALARRDARPQRLLWASTSAKDPTYSDVKYVEALVAPETINTMPRATLAAYRDHGQPEVRIGQDLASAASLAARLEERGIDLAEVADTLEQEGVQKFIEPYEALLRHLAEART